MATQDISRFLLQPTKHYSTVHMQQGRVIVDSDWNERAGIEAEDLRASLVDIVCSRGTPNDGMKITDPDSSVEEGTVDLPVGADFASYNFGIGAGSYYVGGLRLVVDAGETFLEQKDWLQLDVDDSLLPPKVTSGFRTDLVYLYAWEQPVTAVEDSELREVALGGRDTSTRVRRMRRVVVKTGMTEIECSDAFTEFTSALTSTYTGSVYHAESCELRSGARLELSFVTSSEAEDLCADPAATGYVAAENQAIRIELRDGVTPMWVWGFDNASKLYRVKIDEVDEVDGTTLTFLTEPADLPSMPRAGQVVELIIWGAVLPNLEKVAEMQGAITKVTSSYDPTTKSMTVEAAVSADWVGWLALHEEYYNPADEEPQYLYLRVWDRGAELVDEAHPAEIELVVDDDPVALGSTGLAVKFPQGGIPGDYWIIAARPSTPELVTPWDLSTAGGVPPHGPRRFYAPLGIIAWSHDGAAVQVSDCRTKLRRLCEGGCCTVSVGDGERSFGQVNSIADAIDLVPDGGKICLLPGRHDSNGVLNGRHNIVIEGCGPSSVLVSPTPASTDAATGDPEAFYAPLLKIVDSSQIRVQNLRIEAHSAVGISIEITDDSMNCHHVLLEDLQIFSTGAVNGGNGVYEYVAPGVAVLGASDVEIRNCDFEQDAVPGISEAVVLGGRRLRLIDSRVTAPVWNEEVTFARGGVNIRSGSYDVEILGCVIEGGWGHGISVGHVDEFDRTPPAPVSQELWQVLSKPVGTGLAWILPNGNTGSIQPARGGKEVVSAPGTDKVVLPLGPVESVRIHDNVIRQMGLSGISTAEFFRAIFEWDAGDKHPVFIVAANFDICRNTIEDNVVRTNLPETLALAKDDFVGGICLAASINPVIRENRIMRNGSGNYRLPICGIGLLAAQNVVIEDNQVVDNGVLYPDGDEGAPVTLGLRGGVVIFQVTPVRGFTFPQSTTGPTLWTPTTNFVGASGGSAVVLRGNEVIQPLGRALWVYGSHGAVTVTGNTLESFGHTEPDEPWYTLALTAGGASVTKAMLGACVEIHGYSKALDVPWIEGYIDEIPVPSWVDAADETLEDGGNTLVSGNVIRMTWNKIGGISTAVLISTLASAVFDNNDVTVGMSGGFESFEETISEQMADFFAQILLNEQGFSFAMSSVYVAGYSTGQANGNRIIEGKYDALFSLTVASIVRPGGGDIQDVTHAVSATANILSHDAVLLYPGDFTSPPVEIVQTSNAAIFEQATVNYGVRTTSAPDGGIGRQIRIAALP